MKPVKLTPEQARERRLESSRRWCEANRELKRERNRLWKAENPSKALESYHRWREANPDKAREVSRKWKAENPAKARESYRRSRAANPDKAREAVRAWYAAHPERAFANSAKRRALTRGATVGDPKAVAAIYEKAKSKRRVRCAYCGRYPRVGERHVDHVIPLAKGGPHTAANLRITCAQCNLSKGTPACSASMSAG